MSNFKQADFNAERFRRHVFPPQIPLAGASGYSTNIANGATATPVDEVATDGFACIFGVCRSDKALTVKIYQGYTDDDLETVMSISVSAGASEGQGTYFSVPVVGNLARIDVSNASGSDTTALRFQAWLAGASGGAIVHT